jgi:hypothetical protein
MTFRNSNVKEMYLLDPSIMDVTHLLWFRRQTNWTTGQNQYLHRISLGPILSGGIFQLILKSHLSRDLAGKLINCGGRVTEHYSCGF